MSVGHKKSNEISTLCEVVPALLYYCPSSKVASGPLFGYLMKIMEIFKPEKFWKNLEIRIHKSVGL